MSKSNNIRWRKSDTEELNRLVKNFNQKVSYHQKKNPEFSESYPEKYSVKELKQLIKTRNDFNLVCKKLARFSERGAEKLVTNKQGVTLTKYEIKETAINTRYANKQLKKLAEELQKLPKKIGGVDAPNVQQKINEDRVEPFQEPKFEKAKNAQHFRDFSKAAEKKMFDSSADYADKLYFNNLKLSVDMSTSISTDFKTKIKNLLDRIGVSNIITLYNEGYEEVTFDFFYDLALDENQKYNRLLNVASRYL